MNHLFLSVSGKPAEYVSWAISMAQMAHAIKPI